MKPRLLGLLPLLSGCASFSLAADDLRALHEEAAGGGLAHRSEIARPSPLARIWRRSFLSGIFPGLTASIAKPAPRTVADPARLCRESVLVLRSADRDDPAEVAEAVSLASMVLAGDLFPLSRADAAAALVAVAPRVELSWREEPGYEDAALQALRRLAARSQDPGEEALRDPAKRAEYASAIEVLGNAPYRRASEALGMGLYVLSRLRAIERDRGLRAKIDEAIAHCSARAARLALRAGLSDRSEFVREVCVEGIARVEGEGALPFLAKAAASDPSPAVRRRFVRLCARKRAATGGEDPVLEALVAAASDPDPSVSTNAMDALAVRTGSGPILDREYWKAWWKGRLLAEPASGARGAPPPRGR